MDSSVSQGGVKSRPLCLVVRSRSSPSFDPHAISVFLLFHFFLFRFGSTLLGYPDITIDYRCEEACFLRYASCVTTSNPFFAFQQFNRGKFWIKKMQKSSLVAQCQKAIDGIYPTKQKKAEALKLV
jgi:hypothetical protein